MNKVMNLFIWAAICGLFICLIPQSRADDSYIMKTEEGGYLLLTEEPCKFGANGGYDYAAYAFHVGEDVYNGCWKDIGPGVAVVFPGDPAQYAFAKRQFTKGQFDQVEK